MTMEVISSRANARVKQLRGAFAGQARLSGGLVAIEGEHLLEEALRSGMVLRLCLWLRGVGFRRSCRMGWRCCG